MRLPALLAGTALLGCAGLWAASSPDRLLPAAPSARAAARETAVRIRYPAGHYPELILPDGQRRAVHSLLNQRRPLRFGDYLWDDAGVPPGRIWVRIDLARQTLSVFRGGHEIGATIVLFGTDGKPTPTGTFTVIDKAETHRSTLYDAPMPFMLRLTGDGVAIHASHVVRGSATHGCIGVPPDFARRLFTEVRRGDQVVILPLGNEAA